jgi:hypothetical protein
LDVLNKDTIPLADIPYDTPIRPTSVPNAVRMQR